MALLLSLCVHAGLLLLRFADPEAFNRLVEDSPLEVVLVNASTATAPQKAQVIAQRNLAGGGDALQGRVSTPLPPSLQNQSGDSFEEARRQIEQMQVQQMMLLAQLKRELAALGQPDSQKGAGATAKAADEERRRQLLALLGQIEKRIHDESARPRRRFVSPAAREGVHAIYYDTLRRRIEDLGTRNFPEANGQKLYGELTMMVAVDIDGRVAQAEVIESSRNRTLDRRAVSIVKAASPFGPFTAAMRSQFDQLVFISRFRFTRDEGLRAAVEDASVQRP
ncbi:MAG: TonB family protein [Leptothrix sp. (in: Bacteria)]|nr:TonB family protein [Leptothrix sp. (in: b-proteobacteria)]HQY09732.1 TonB family protein [Burkholderiaceae bacterium]